MFRRKRKALEEKLPEKVVRRAGMIPASELMTWVDTTLVSIDQQMRAIRRYPDSQEVPARYGEVLQSSEALVAILREVSSRQGSFLSPTPPSV